MSEAEKDPTVAEIDRICRQAVRETIELSKRQTELAEGLTVLSVTASNIAINVIEALAGIDGSNRFAEECRRMILDNVAGHTITARDSREPIQ